MTVLLDSSLRTSVELILLKNFYEWKEAKSCNELAGEIIAHIESKYEMTKR